MNIDCRGKAFKIDQYILVTQVKQVFYLEDKAKPYWRDVNHKTFSDGGVIVVEDDPDIIHFDNSSDLPLSTSLNDLDNATLHIDGQSMEVDAPLDIIDVVDQDDDITDDEDALPHDLADSDDEDLINVDDDGVDKMSADVARSHGGDGGGEDRPPPYYVPTGCMGCFANRGKGKRKPNLGGRAAGRLNTRNKTRNLSLKEITDKKGPVPIRFELRDKQTLMPLDDHVAHWSSYIGEVIRGVPLYYPSWLKVPKERKAALITDIGTQFDLRPHMESPDWTEINAGIQQHLQKAYNTNKAAFKAQHWVIDPTTGTYNVEKIRRARPEDITAEEWDKYIQFWNDPRNIARAAQNRQNRAKSTVISRQGSRSLARLRDEMEEMRRLEATGTYTDDEINRLARRGKQRGHIPGVGRVLPAPVTAGPSTPTYVFTKFETGVPRSGGCGDDEESVDDQEDEDGDGDS
ncbi:F-box domain containing protein [Tanacetum coccineum]